jgi:hypothetical protein
MFEEQDTNEIDEETNQVVNGAKDKKTYTVILRTTIKILIGQLK